MKVSDVMTRDPVAIDTGATFKKAVDLMLSHDVGALPVVDDLGRVIGIVSEADLVPKAGWSGAGRRPLLALLDGDDGACRKAHGRTVADLMTGRPFTLRPGDDVAVAARTLFRSRHKRAPVVDQVGLLAGMVSRQDLLGAYARPDGLIAGEVATALGDPMRAPEGHAATARVCDGVVTLSGWVGSEDDRRVVLAVAWRVPGVVDVVDELVVGRPAPVAVSGPGRG